MVIWFKPLALRIRGICSHLSNGSLNNIKYYYIIFTFTGQVKETC